MIILLSGLLLLLLHVQSSFYTQKCPHQTLAQDVRQKKSKFSCQIGVKRRTLYISRWLKARGESEEFIHVDHNVNRKLQPDSLFFWPADWCWCLLQWFGSQVCWLNAGLLVAHLLYSNGICPVATRSSYVSSPYLCAAHVACAAALVWLLVFPSCESDSL